MFDHVPAPAGEAWNWADATPEPASAEFDVTTTEPRTFAAAAGAVTAPVGAVVSIVNVTAAVAVLPALSAPVTVYVAGALAPLAQTKVLDAYGPPAGVVSVSALWVVQPAALKLGNVAEAAPEPASVTVATKPKLPAAFDLKYTLPALRYAPVGPFARASDTLGAALSTRTLVTVGDVKVRPALSVVITRTS
jgi:hypothetical protein